ncbi:MAG: helix-turn-helix domain-containing protein [Candidatus Dormibacteria bacterium]
MSRNLTVPETATKLRVSPHTVWRRVWANDIPSLRIGGRVVIPETALRRWCEANTRGGEASPAEAIPVGAPR